MSVSEVVSNLNSEPVHRHFGSKKIELELMLQKWFNVLKVRNVNAAKTYVHFLRTSLGELKASADELLSKLKSGA